LTTTSLPFRISARCTCAIEAEASGAGSIRVKSCRPMSCAIAGSIAENGSGGALSVRFASSSM